MRVVTAPGGTRRAGHRAGAMEKYERGPRRYWPLDVIELREATARGVTPEQARERESTRLAERIPEGADLVVCDEAGQRGSSREFAGLMGDFRTRARSVAFAIGGAFGLTASLRDRASRGRQLAPWPLPHEVARLVLAEQLYRAGTILRGEPYHK